MVQHPAKRPMVTNVGHNAAPVVFLAGSAAPLFGAAGSSARRAASLDQEYLVTHAARRPVYEVTADRCHGAGLDDGVVDFARPAGKLA